MSTLSAPHLEVVLERLRGAGVEIGGEVTARQLAGGRSNETFALEVEGEARWVLRRPPLLGRTPSAHDVGREHRVTAALSAAGFPVARPIVLDNNVDWGPFTVVEFVAGEAIRTRDDLDRLSDSQVDGVADALISSLVDLHDLDHDAIGLSGFGRPDGYAERQLRRWSGQWEIVGDERPEAAELLHRLRSSVPRSAEASIVHGDYRVDNALVQVDGVPRIAAVVDWELSTIGEPVADLALMAVYRHPDFDDVLGFAGAWTSDRWPSPQGLVERYARRSGRHVDHWDFHLGLACYKLAVISAGIDYRTRVASDGQAGTAAASAVTPILEAGLSGWGA